MLAQTLNLLQVWLQYKTTLIKHFSLKALAVTESAQVSPAKCLFVCLFVLNQEGKKKHIPYYVLNYIVCERVWSSGTVQDSGSLDLELEPHSRQYVCILGQDT